MAKVYAEYSGDEMDEATRSLTTSEFDHLYEKYDGSKEKPFEPPLLVTRDKWGAVPPRYREPLCTPVGKVLLLDTRTDFCMCEETCGIVLRKLQKHYMEEKGLSDIPWNFMIGEDGHVYEGRGWVTNASKTLPETEQLHCSTLDIAYIGNYQAKVPTRKQYTTLYNLIDIGMGKTIIEPDYEIKSELMNDFVEEEFMKTRKKEDY